MIHEQSDVKCEKIGSNANIWQYVVILPSAKIGDDVNICSHCFIENDVTIGNRVTIKSGVQIWDGIEIEDDVFIGPNVSFSNDKYPRSKQYQESCIRTIICKGASIGAGAVILPGIVLGENCMIGAGAVVTKNVPPNAIVRGNPGRIEGYVSASSNTISHIEEKGIDQSKEVSVKGVSLHLLPKVNDIRGSLSVGEFENEIPFSVKRYFLVFDVPSREVRGEHAHKECHQFLVCAKGSCSVVVDDGKNRQEFLLDSCNKGIYLPPMIWGIQYRYSKDAVLLVFASHYYDKDDYIRDYGEFIRESQKNA